MRRCEAKSDLPGNLLATKSLIGHGAKIPVWSWTTLDGLSKKSRNGDKRHVRRSREFGQPGQLRTTDGGAATHAVRQEMRRFSQRTKCKGRVSA